MAYLVDTIKTYIVSLDEDEISTIIDALFDCGHNDIAKELFDQMPPEFSEPEGGAERLAAIQARRCATKSRPARDWINEWIDDNCGECN